MAAKKQKETHEGGSVTVRFQHHTGADLQEFEYPLDPPAGDAVEKKAECERRAALYGMSHTRTVSMIGSVKTCVGVLSLAMSAVDTREGGWAEVLVGDVVRAAHPRERARANEAEWVGNLGSDK